MGEKIKERTINIKELNAKSIEFYKRKLPKKGSEINSDMQAEYNWILEEENESKVQVIVLFQFAPDVLFKGKIVFEVEITNNGGIIKEDEKQAITDAIESRIVNDCSFLATVCGEAISGTKFIIPPIFTRGDVTADA